MKKIFWLVKDGKRTGPHRSEEIQAKIAAGDVLANDLVFYPGSKGLEKIGDLGEFDFSDNSAATEAPADSSAPAPTPEPERSPEPAVTPPPVAQERRESVPVQQSPPPPKARLPQPHQSGEPQPQPLDNQDQQRRPSTRILSRRELEKESSRLETDLERVRASQRAVSADDMKQTTPLAPRRQHTPDSPRPFQKKPAPPTELSSHQHAPKAKPAPAPAIEIDYSFAEDAVREEEAYQQNRDADPPQESKISPPPMASGTSSANHQVQPRSGSKPGDSGDLYGMQTVVITAPGRKTRPRASEPVERERSTKEADRQYPDVIKAALRTDEAPEDELAPNQRDPLDMLPAARNLQLQQSMEERKPKNKIKPEFENSLGQGFVAVEGLPLGFAIWPVRVKDFRAFVTTAQYDAGDKWRNPDFLQLGDNPVTYVSYEDANAFCFWLTQKERQEGWIDNKQAYRLPFDSEWSIAVGLKEVGTKMPYQLDGKNETLYPWGTEWPPPKGIGNYSDESADRKFGWGVLAKGFDDGYVYTSPVGTFPPNKNRLFDMGGNVWEWVEDWYDETRTTRTLRGGSWTTSQKAQCLSSAREADPPEARRGKNGFRIVLAAE